MTRAHIMQALILSLRDESSQDYARDQAIIRRFCEHLNRPQWADLALNDYAFVTSEVDDWSDDR